MIEVKNLHKHFGSLKVLTGIDDVINDGEVVVVIGPSGSGKSTYLRCLNLLENPNEGEIYIDGVRQKHRVYTAETCDWIVGAGSIDVSRGTLVIIK